MTHIPTIKIKCIDPENQRFGECGDFFYDADADELTIFVNKMADWRSEAAVAFHEAMEFLMCLDKDIDQTDIDFFDKGFYKEHNEGQAGDDKNSPYHLQHIAATFVEQEVCSQLGLPWKQHEENCEA